MATDGDLWARAVARGLDPATGTLLIVRPAGVTIVACGRRVLAGAPAPTTLPASGLYEARNADRGVELVAMDRAGGAARLEGVTAPASGGPVWALVEQVDPAAHADE